MSGQEIKSVDGQDNEPVRNQAEIDYEQGKSFVEAGDLALAAAAFHNALVDYEEQGDDKGVANASDQLGDICAGRDEYQKALEHYQRAATICSNDFISLLHLQKKLAKVFLAQKKYEKAAAAYLELLDMYRDNNNPAGAVEALEQLSGIYLDMGDKQRAADALRTAAQVHTHFKHARHAQALIERAEAIEAGA